MPVRYSARGSRQVVDARACARDASMAPPKRKAEDDPPPAPSPSRRSERTKNAEDPPPSSSKDDDDVAAPAPPPADAPAPAKAKLPALDALAKAKAVLQKQKELAEKLKKVPKLTPAAPAPAIVAMEGAAGRTIPIPPPPPPPSSSSVVAPAKFTGPGALRLNEKGEEVDEHGRVIVKNIVEVSTFKVNAKRTKLEEFAASEKETEAEAAGGGDDDWMDPRMGKAGKQRGRRGGFQVRCVRRAPFVRRPPVLSAPRRAVRSRIPPRTIRFFNLERAHCILSKPRGRPRRRGDYRMRQRSFSRL